MQGGKTFAKQIARAFEAILTSTFKRGIGRQFLMYLLSLSFFLINVIMACFCELDNSPCSQDPGKRGYIVAETLLPMMCLGPRKLGNICCGHKMSLNKIKHFLCPGKFVSATKCCACGQTGKHLCRQQCVRNNVSSFARAFRKRYFVVILNKTIDKNPS